MNNPEAFIIQYESALATQEWENVAPFIHENCAATFSEGTYIGKPKVETAFRRTFALIQDEKYSIRNIHWVYQSETIATFIYNFSWSGIIDGKATSGSGRGTSVLVKQGERWQLICEHLGPEATS